MDSRTPVIVGAAQVLQRPTDWADPEQARGPIELMAAATTEAIADAGAPRLRERIGWVGVVAGLWSFANPGRLVAAEIGAPAVAATALSAISGSAPQDLVGLAAERITAGELDVALVVGGEARASSLRLRKLDQPPRWVTASGDGEPERLTGLSDDAILETRSLGVAAVAYALFEDSLRLAAGESIDAHRDRIGQLWAGFSAVAAANPFAWDRSTYDAATIREPTPDNRMIAFPYTKAMVANNTVDMASAVVVCSLETARALGVSRERLVFPLVSTTSHDTWRIVNRDLLHETPALAVAGRAALDYGGVKVEELSHVDLYACFPSVVQMSVNALGFDPEQALTVTGGLGFAGAPLANSSGHAIAAMVERLRSGGVGLIHANGGSATKHAFGLYSDQPGGSGFRRIDIQDDVDLSPREAVDANWSGDDEVEAATVSFDREGPTHVVAAMRTADGRRALVRSADPDLIDLAMSDGLGGVQGPLPAAERLRDPD